jgi:hypothetical protein
MHIAPRPNGTDPQDTVARLQKLLAEALTAREWALTRLLELEAQVERHWFVPDDGGQYCRACNLPRINRRHTTSPRTAA